MPFNSFCWFCSGRRLTDYIHSYRTKCSNNTKEESSNISLASTVISPEDPEQPIPSIDSVVAEPELQPYPTAPSVAMTTYTKDDHAETALPEVTLKRWFSEIIEALHNLHMENIYCFDLHPNNILLGARGEILLSYFYKTLHQAKFNYCMWDPLMSEYISPLYIAPERPLNAKSDWWSAGLIFFELFTGRTFEACHPNGMDFYFEIQYPEELDIQQDLNSLLHGVRILFSF